ncbi:MAG TPA: NlpC/P60 family protein, partial [Armatimonadota bacterium]
MHPRLLLIGILALVEILGLLGVANSATDATGYEAYVVQARQTLTGIASEYGIPVAVLAQYNKLRVTDALQAGQILLVPLSGQLAPQSNTYTGAETTATTTVSNAPRSDANHITGVVGTVTAKRTEIRSEPNGGRVLFDKVTAGKDLLVIGQTDTHYGVLMSDGSTGWVPRIALALSDTNMVVDRPAVDVKPVTAGRQDLVDTAFEYLGTPYRLGGTLPNSVDCSLLVQTVFRRNGLSLPRTAAQQFQVGMPVDTADLLPGDRLYFYDRDHSRIGHTALYVGNGRFIHASSNRGAVAVDDLS